MHDLDLDAIEKLFDVFDGIQEDAERDESGVAYYRYLIRALVARVRELEDACSEMYSYGQCHCDHPACKKCKATKFADEVLRK